LAHSSGGLFNVAERIIEVAKGDLETNLEKLKVLCCHAAFYILSLRLYKLLCH
jgi:hypothetical protein